MEGGINKWAGTMVFVDFENLWQLLSTWSQRWGEARRTASMSASTPANPSKRAEESVNNCGSPLKGDLLIRFSRLGRESNILSAAEATVS